MTYASHTRRPNPAALAGALGIPAAVGALLIVGLAVKIVIAPEPPRIKGETYTDVPLPPPPPTPDQPKPTNRDAPQTSTVTTLPPRADMLPVDLGTNNPVTSLPGTGDLIGTGVDPVDFGIPDPTPSASMFEPIGAKPRGKPGNWVTNADYRPRWIREGLTGTARFALNIDASGKVTGCTITRSTGHAALDEATCQLVTKRARFDAARDSSGKPVAGNFSNTITWNIPE
jgi:periplasmic protein TonB